MRRQRLDVEMVRRGLASSRTSAKALIEESKVSVRGIPTPKPSTLVGNSDAIELVDAERAWVSRGAHKLIGALETFDIDPHMKSALDVGASTGGFTEVLIDRGARSVTALDVGRNQLHERIAANPRVNVIEGMNFRHVDVEAIGGPFQLVVVDLSFISLCTVAERLAAVSTETADLVLLIKPQFEASRKNVGKGGVVKDRTVHRRTVEKVVSCLQDSGLNAQGLVESSITGTKGNTEFLLWVRKDRSPTRIEVAG